MELDQHGDVYFKNMLRACKSTICISNYDGLYLFFSYVQMYGSI
jgi:hypothetical protein